jgi:hypothetical protein
MSYLLHAMRLLGYYYSPLRLSYGSGKTRSAAWHFVAGNPPFGLTSQEQNRMTDYPFEVPVHDHMIATVPGKRPGTVLTLERQIYTFRICEYTEPISYGRHWCYQELPVAVQALADYLVQELAVEPQRWVRAIDFGDDLDAAHEWIRVRRARVEHGQRVVVVDDSENDPWA